MQGDPARPVHACWDTWCSSIAGFAKHREHKCNSCPWRRCCSDNSGPPGTTSWDVEPLRDTVPLRRRRCLRVLQWYSASSWVRLRCCHCNSMQASREAPMRARERSAVRGHSCEQLGWRQGATHWIRWARWRNAGPSKARHRRAVTGADCLAPRTWKTTGCCHRAVRSRCGFGARACTTWWRECSWWRHAARGPRAHRRGKGIVDRCWRAMGWCHRWGNVVIAIAVCAEHCEWSQGQHTNKSNRAFGTHGSRCTLAGENAGRHTAMYSAPSSPGVA